MTLIEYQERAQEFAIYRDKDTSTFYPYFKLAGEVGEICEKVGKAIRDGIPNSYEQELAKELGDVLWYTSAIAQDLGYTLECVAQMNIAKLTSRRERGVLGGSGDNR